MSADDRSQMNTQPNDYNITITNCNSITKAEITLRRGSLNIKYGPNGIGKSTIAHALVLNAKGDDDDGLQKLLPFKYHQCDNGPVPAVVGADEIKNVLVFDEEYVSQFVFRPDEVVKDSFEIFVNTPDYQSRSRNLDTIFEDLKKLLLENETLDEVTFGLTELTNVFITTKSGAIAKNSKGSKALSVSGKLDAVPDALKDFEDFLRSSDPAGWLSWQAKGKEYLELSENCPFCAIPEVDKGTAMKVSDEYETSAVRNMAALRDTIDKLERFVAPGPLQRLKKITTSLEEPSPEDEKFLAALRGQAETLLGKFKALKEPSFLSLRDEPDLDKALGGMRIELEQLHVFNSEGTQGLVRPINEKLDEITQQNNEIKKLVGTQKTQVAKSIEQNQGEINGYLRSAGYKYKVRIEPSDDSYRMIVEHQDTSGHVQDAGSRLSFGERNAFALVLFMHQVRRDKPDLVVLDDPVSSFDKTKKFAIFHKLFKGSQSLKDFTTLLLTHDIEPAIDMVRTGASKQFQGARPAVHFLQSREGRVKEKPIQKDDITTFSQVCDKIVASQSVDPIVKCIYLRRRYEVHGKCGAEYDVLSSLIKARDQPTLKDRHTPLDKGASEQAIAKIKEVIATFDYETLLAQIKDCEALKNKFMETDVGYDKVQIFRIASNPDLCGAAEGDHAFKKFVNETYHIENEYVMQLNPREFEAVPDHVVQKCAELLGVAPTAEGLPPLGDASKTKLECSTAQTPVEQLQRHR